MTDLPDRPQQALPSTAEIIEALIKGVMGLVPGGSLVAEAFGLLWMTADRLLRAGEAVDAMAEEAGGADPLLQALHNEGEYREVLEVLVIEAVEAASRSADQRKRRLLGRTAGAAIRDLAQIDRSQLRIMALRELDQPHIAALAYLLGVQQRATEEHGYGGDELTEQQTKQVERVVREASEGLPHAVLQRLALHGLVASSESWDGTVRIVTRITEEGELLLRDLDAEATTIDASTRPLRDEPG